MISRLPTPPEVRIEIAEGRSVALTAPRMIEVLTVIAQIYRVGKLDIISPNRRPHMVVARNAFYWCAKHITPRGYSEIGRFINRHHTSVMHGVDTVDANLTFYAPRLRMAARILGVPTPQKLEELANG